MHQILYFRPMDLSAGEHLQEWYLKINPQHTVPTLDDNGIIIWDSHAICTYLIGKYATSDALYPTDLVQRARIDQRLHFDSSVLFASLLSALRPILRSGATEFIPATVDAWYDAIGILEAFLVTDKYLVGNQLTVADICCATTVATGEALFTLDAEKYPKTLAWIERVFQLPYVNNVSGKINGSFRTFFNQKLAENRAASA